MIQHRWRRATALLLLFLSSACATPQEAPRQLGIQSTVAEQSKLQKDGAIITFLSIVLSVVGAAAGAAIMKR